MDRPHRHLLLSALVCCGAVLGCTDPAEVDPVRATLPAAPATVDDARWSESLTDGCVALEEEHAALGSWVPDDADSARRHAAAVAAFTADYAALLTGVDDPAGDPAGGRAVRQLAVRLAAAGRELEEAAVAGDAAAAERAVGRLDRIGAALDAALEPWDVATCRGFGELEVTTP